MREFSSWSQSLGKWHGVHVRVHAFFLLFAVCTLYLVTRGEAWENQLIYGAIGLAILMLSVLAHEIGHCAAAFRLGGNADQIVIGPIGGLTSPHVAHEPQNELLVAVAGPAVNLVLMLATAPFLMLAGEGVLDLLNPLQPTDLILGPSSVVVLKLVFWINWLLLLINLLPAFPLDGGRVVRSILWPYFDYRTAVLAVARGAQIIAVGMCVFAYLMHDAFMPSIVPAWLPMVLLAMLLFFCARQEVARLEDQELDEELFSYDFSQGYTSLERHLEPSRASALGRLKSWFEARREARLERQRSIELEEERQIDEILARLHARGMKALSAKERALLERVSARYRNRTQS